MDGKRHVIYGQPPSKSNCYRIVIIAGHGSLAKTPALKKYEDDFFAQCPMRGAMITGRFSLEVDVYFRSDRPDLDNSMKTILDCLQMCKVIKNDRQCMQIIMRKFKDKKEPRIEFRIEEMT